MMGFGEAYGNLENHVIWYKSSRNLLLYMQIMEVPSLLQEGSTGVKRNILKNKQEQQVPPLGSCCSWSEGSDYSSGRGSRHSEEGELGVLSWPLRAQVMYVHSPSSFSGFSFQWWLLLDPVIIFVSQRVPSLVPSSRNAGSWMCILSCVYSLAFPFFVFT